MATKKKTAKKEEIPCEKAVAFVKKIIKWQKEVEEIKARNAGGDTPPPPKWP